jgi:hypothetical protein
MIHANSLSAYATTPLSDRESQVLAALERLGGIATDRQIAKEMGSDDPNVARPRCTTLIKRGVLREVGSDLSTGRKCRLVEVAQ